MTASKSKKRNLSVKLLKGILRNPNRKPVTIEEMNEAVMWAACKGNVPDSVLLEGLPPRLKAKFKLS